MRHAEEAMLSETDVLELFGWLGTVPRPAGAPWRHLAEAAFKAFAFEAPAASCIDLVLRQGPLARRIWRAFSPDQLRAVYGELCACLEGNRPFGDAAG